MSHVQFVARREPGNKQKQQETLHPHIFIYLAALRVLECAYQRENHWRLLQVPNSLSEFHWVKTLSVWSQRAYSFFECPLPPGYLAHACVSCTRSSIQRRMEWYTHAPTTLHRSICPLQAAKIQEHQKYPHMPNNNNQNPRCVLYQRNSLCGHSTVGSLCEHPGRMWRYGPNCKSN